MRYRLRNFPLYKRHYQTGFTLIELMIVMAIIAILAVLGIVAIQTARRTARDTQRKDNVRTMQMALEQWYIIYKSYPRCRNAITCNGGINDLAAGVSLNNGHPLNDLFNAPLDGTGLNLETSGILTSLKDPNGFELTDAPPGSNPVCDSSLFNFNEWYARGSYRYKVSTDKQSYGIVVRSESKGGTCPSLSQVGWNGTSGVGEIDLAAVSNSDKVDLYIIR